MRFSLLILYVSWMVSVALSQGSFLILVSTVTRQSSDRYSDVLQFDAFRPELNCVKIRSKNITLMV